MLCSIKKSLTRSRSAAAAIPTMMIRLLLARANCSISGAVARQVGHQGDKNHSSIGRAPSTRDRRLTGFPLTVSTISPSGRS